MKLPGSRALAFASRWFDPATVHRTFEPLIADWQREWIDAPRSTRWIVHVKGIAAFAIAAIVSMPAIVRTRAPKPLTDQIARRVAIGAGIGTVILMLPFVREIGPQLHRGVVLPFLIPQALTIVFPFALLPGVDAIRRFDGVDSQTARAAVSKLAVLGLVFVFFCHGWVTPAANQVYREIVSEGRPRPGVREMSNAELLTRWVRAGESEPGTYQYATATSLQKEINNRAALAVLPVLLLWRRWRALDLPAHRWFSARHSALAAVAMIVVFLALSPFGRLVEQSWRMPAGAGPWLTLAFLAALGSARVWLAERSAARA